MSSRSKFTSIKNIGLGVSSVPIKTVRLSFSVSDKPGCSKKRRKKFRERAALALVKRTTTQNRPRVVCIQNTTYARALTFSPLFFSGFFFFFCDFFITTVVASGEPTISPVLGAVAEFAEIFRRRVGVEHTKRVIDLTIKRIEKLVLFNLFVNPMYRRAHVRAVDVNYTGEPRKSLLSLIIFSQGYVAIQY